MPHVIVKLYPGRPEETKQQLADKIAADVAALCRCDEKVVSVAIEEVDPEDWAETVYRPEIDAKRGTLYKKPGYNPLT